MRIRQVVLAARELEPVVASLTSVLGTEVCFRDPNVGVFGLQNAVMALGDTFLEIVCPVTAEASAARYLERRGGDAGYMVILQCDDLEQERKRVAALAMRVAWSIDLPEISATHLHPRDVGGAILSLDAARPPSSWLWAGPDWQSRPPSEIVRAITGIGIQASRPAALADRWSRILGRPLSAGEAGDPRIAVEGGFIDFEKETDGRGEGLSRIVLDIADRGRFMSEARASGLPVRDGEVVICGTRIQAQ